MHWLKQVAVLWNFCNLLWTKISTLLPSTEVAFFVVGHFVLILTYALGCERKVNKGMEWWALRTKIWNNRAEFTNILWLRRIRKCALSHIQMGPDFCHFCCLMTWSRLLDNWEKCTLCKKTHLHIPSYALWRNLFPGSPEYTIVNWE